MAEDRKELVLNAVEFLKDPNVANAPLEKKTEFLKNKGLHDTEITDALLMASSLNNENHKVAVGPGFGNQYGNEPFNRYEQAVFAPPIPERDWKDYFIMATTTVSLAYGIYTVFKNVIIPSMKPQSFDQVETDKAAMNMEFERIQKLLDKLEANNAEMMQNDQKNSKELEETVQKLNELAINCENKLTKNNDDLSLIKLELGNLKDNYGNSALSLESLVTSKLESINKEIDSLKKLLSSRLSSVDDSESSLPPSLSPHQSTSSPITSKSPQTLAGSNSIPPASSIPSAADLLKNMNLAKKDVNTAAPVPKGKGKEIDRTNIPSWQLSGDN